jgi:hypothetical protein
LSNYHFGANWGAILLALALCTPRAALSTDFPGSARITVPEQFTQTAISKDGRWIALYGSAPSIRLIDARQPGDAGKLFEGVQGTVSSALFDETSEELFVFENVEDLSSKFHRVPLSNPAALVSFDIDTLPSDTVRGPNQTVIMADLFAPKIVAQRTSCDEPASTSCAEPVREFGSREPTVMSRVAYTGRAVNYVLASASQSGDIFAYDYHTGELAFTIPSLFHSSSFSRGEEYLSMGLDVAAANERVTIYVSVGGEKAQQRSQESVVFVVDIDPMLKEWFPIIHIRSAADPKDVGKPHHLIGTPLKEELINWEWLVRDQRPKVAVSRDQSAIFLLDGRSALAQLRREGGGAFVPVHRYHATDSIILDFAVSEDGRRLAVLLPHEMLLLPIDPSRDPFQGSEERSLIAAVQRKLTETGFYLGSVNGEISDQLRQAVHNYQRAKGLPNTGLGQGSNINPDTLAGLFANDLEALSGISGDIMGSVVDKEFTRYYGETVGPWVDSFTAAEFLAGFRNCSDGVANPTVRSNIGRLAAVLDELRRRYGRPLRLAALDPSHCSEIPAAHEELRAVLMELGSPPEMKILTAAAQDLVDDGYPIEAIEERSRGIYIAVRPLGSEIDFEDEGSLALVSTYEPSPEGCREARSDADDYALNLSMRGLQGARLVVVERSSSKTDKSGFALAIAAKPEKSRRAIEILRQAARTSTDQKTRPEAFLIKGKDWEASERCLASRKIN